VNLVRYEVAGPVVTVTIDRPEVRNAVNSETAAALRECFGRFEADGDLNVAVLTGAGRTFCAGYDLKELAHWGSGLPSPPLQTGEEPGPMGPTRMLLDKPVIAAIEGYAVAGGLELALWCDLRVAAEDATLGVFNRRFGVPLIDLGPCGCRG
jgi:enoyl-CoA hydratase